MNWRWFCEHISGPLTAVLILLPSLSIAPVGDDYRVIDTAQPLSVAAFAEDLQFGSRGGPHYRPLEPILLRIEHPLWHEFSPGYHATNVALHASSAWLTSRIAFHLLGSWPAAAAAGVLFAVHPLAAPAAGHIAARNILLVCLFLLLSVWSFLRYQTERRIPLLVVSVAAFGVGLLAKEQAYLFPAVLLPLAFQGRDPSPGSASVRRRRRILVAGTALAVTAGVMLAGRELLVPLLSSQFGYHTQLTRLAYLAYALAATAPLVLALASAVLRFPDVAPIAWFLVVEGLVIGLGLLPSGRLVEGAGFIQGNPFSLSLERLARDLFVLLSLLGAMIFGIRERLVSLASTQPLVIAALWLSSAAMAVLLLLRILSRRPVIIAGLVWLVVAMGPLRIRPVEFFELNNLYLAVPILVLALTSAVTLIRERSARFVIPSVAVVGMFWASGSLDAQWKLVSMGSFARELHAVFEGESRQHPGPLRVIVNVPDPFGSVTEDPSLAHWMVFRVVQSAMRLGGYSDANTAFVEDHAVQVLFAAKDTGCLYEAAVVDPERIVVRSADARVAASCISDVQLIDFINDGPGNPRAVHASRKPQFAGRPLTQAEVYGFDGHALHRLH